jgi:hypothetical protein
MQESVGKIKYAVREIQMLRKENFEKIKYEISNDLPSARLVILSLTGRTFLRCAYNLASHHGEVDEDTLSTFHHTFFVYFLYACVVGGVPGSGSGPPQIPLPSRP